MIQRLFRAILFSLLALLGLAMAFIVTFSTLIAVLILSVISAIRGKPFAAKEYWTQRQERSKSLLKKGALPTHNKADVTDLEAREVPRDPIPPR